MTSYDLILAAAAGAVCLAISVALWSHGQRRNLEARIVALKTRLIQQGGSDDAPAWLDAFDTAVIAVEGGRANLVAGGEGLIACAKALGADAEVSAVVAALSDADPNYAQKLTALFERGEPCVFEARGPHGLVSVEGRAAGALAWLRLAPIDRADSGLPTAARFAAFVDSVVEPCWIAGADGQAIWGNAAFVRAVGAASAQAPALAGKSFDRGADAVVVEAAGKGERREALRWINVEGRRRAFRLSAQPLDGGGVGVFCADVTEIEDVRDAFKKHVEAHDETLNHIAEAVAIFSQTRRLSYHNTAFAELWGLEPAWLADRPTHGEVLDRLRQRRRLPETIDYAGWKAAELARYEDLGPQADDLWDLPDGRTLKVVRQPHPLGGMLLIYSDITGELRLKAQYNALIQVQQATLDKLNDAVAVFGSDGRLRLHNEAFETFWNVTPHALEAAGDFEGVVELCVPRLHDLSFWRELKGRVADPDPQMRAPTSGEVRTSDSRIVLYQSRPLPDGATLIAFADVTDTRDLQSALADRSAALAEAERLKRDFVGNVSYELRTPLTTIIGYSELLERADGISERGRNHVAAVRAAATQLARSIDDVLDMAQIDAGEMALEIEDIRVSDLLLNAQERALKDAQLGGVTLAVECEEDVGLIRGDGKRLAQTLDHLVENALRQTPPGGRVTLSARRALGEVRLDVSDTGRGVPFHVQAHIFDRFVGRDRGGPGLGLALVKALVELHGGWVALESEPGNGSTFTCHLPETQQPGAMQPELGF
ncbi:cell cycle protein kinase DivL [Caulobacter vibrioides]|uniref:Sensor protein DivL n=2 Tax=Caulobacter vibrioides TaxID=155892 RepID=DIVL_CAUVC|nr:cell cycle protein kinase DivL [Caulobacter vibrioides]YP_002518971.1 two-component sensor histidine kinase DivL [Caulobacter vibrioides NA1000]Q9RQQ9.2 RecName: Full=Sensor protein DivL [Caulobacter vibrioides CB15]QBQ57401.1 PAS domain-containing protein [synthetic Caulobacter sp. 'ethensis']AAK25446.1 tyrosine kinase DivL [Caulobacter vibrioides CB15]ACL97063.1 two-component sensor histidine kinase DivL [Caulobacter vibrioides NA1000]ATC30302.1 two-component sensor histidine kinase [Cau